MVKPDDLGADITMEDVHKEFLKGDISEILERAVGILEDTQNQYKRGTRTVDVCFNLEIIRQMLKKVA